MPEDAVTKVLPNTEKTSDPSPYQLAIDKLRTASELRMAHYQPLTITVYGPRHGNSRYGRNAPGGDRGEP